MKSVPWQSAGSTPAHRHTPATLLVIAAVLCQQMGAAAAVLIFPATGPQGIVALRLIFSALLLFAFARPRLSGHTPAAWRAAAGLGVTLAGMNSLFYEAIARLPLGTAVTIEVLGPLVLSVVVSRRVSALLWATLAFVGVALLSQREMTGVDITGVCFALGAAVCWAAFILFNARTGAAFTGFDGLALGMTIAAVVSLPGAVLTTATTLLEPGILALGLGVAILSSALPYAFELIALRRIPASAFSILTCTAPAVAALAGFAVLGQQLDWIQLTAIILVVIASTGAVRTASRKQTPGSSEVPTRKELRANR